MFLLAAALDLPTGAVVRRRMNGERTTGGGMLANPSLTTSGKPSGTDTGAESVSLGRLGMEQGAVEMKRWFDLKSE